MAELRAIDDPECAVNTAVIAVENCYHSAGRQHITGRSLDLSNSLLNVILSRDHISGVV